MSSMVTLSMTIALKFWYTFNPFQLWLVVVPNHSEIRKDKTTCSNHVNNSFTRFWEKNISPSFNWLVRILFGDATAQRCSFITIDHQTHYSVFRVLLVHQAIWSLNMRGSRRHWLPRATLFVRGWCKSQDIPALWYQIPLPHLSGPKSYPLSYEERNGRSSIQFWLAS